MDEAETDDSGSTLVKSGKSALTFSEMAAFVHDLEARPAPRLMEDLPGLMALPEAKYGLVSMVLRRKTRPEAEESASILARLDALSSSNDPTVRERCKAFLERPE